ncbi:GNAT family N-acetyltransferase [Amorphus orientalis]|uniref:Ribosomal-protein-alanine N-acetyltransferase n=1 Tax=Amorphus orientalis TaxID=649198 RepID=A0AAE3VRX0_9HYPH|nr:GNAT family N-acetyltransferase [Amorphus orientalis]MDQ0317033.1 ribosomal-protein-alanine N-acetyltransferase [Amorphus orientalis]
MATSDDVAEIAAIHAACFSQEWTSDEIAALLSKPGVEALVARRGSLWSSSRPVGFVILRSAADEGEILTIAVRPTHRRSGTGHSLVSAALRHLYKARVTQVFLEVDSENAPALAIYTKLGFKVVGERPSYYAREGKRKGLALVMRCDLG